MTYKNVSAEMEEADYDESYIDGSTDKLSDAAITLWDINAVGADVESCGLSGSPTKVKKIESVILKSEEIKLVENTDDAISEMVHELIADHTLG
jgi:electron transfer flavoprotein beta subunit